MADRVTVSATMPAISTRKAYPSIMITFFMAVRPL
jgi:hypothetical protein